MSKSKKSEVSQESKPKFSLLFRKDNYMLMAIGFAVVIIGFFLMFGGKEDIYSARRITIAPIVVVAGFLIEVIAIMRKPKETDA